MAKVYFTKEITSDSLLKIYEALGVDLKGKVGVKVSTGEAGSKNFLEASLIGPLVQKLNATILECNTAYPGARNTAEDHLKVAEEHGFTSITDVDIMDAEEEMEIPVEISDGKGGTTSGKHLGCDIVGKNLEKYDSMLNLAHFKGHAMGGFGGVLKNQSIGVASRNGKAYIHTAGKTRDPETLWDNLPAQDDFLEGMAEAAKAVSDYFGKKAAANEPAYGVNGANGRVLYIDVMNKMSVDCDCDAHQGNPVMQDIGILASTDPVSLDQAAIDLIWGSDDPGAKDLQARVERQNGRHILPYAEEIGLGSRTYELVEI